MHLAQVWTAKDFGPIHDPVFQPYFLINLMLMESADAWMEVCVLTFLSAIKAQRLTIPFYLQPLPM